MDFFIFGVDIKVIFLIALLSCLINTILDIFVYFLLILKKKIFQMIKTGEMQ